MRARTVDVGKPQAERLRQHLDHPAGKVQGQQQAPLCQALEPVLATRGDQKLQPWPVSLTSSP
ncbi:hypothetical protein ACE1SV_64250 [Streptomyces sp. E-15]